MASCSYSSTPEVEVDEKNSSSEECTDQKYEQEDFMPAVSNPVDAAALSKQERLLREKALKRPMIFSEAVLPHESKKFKVDDGFMGTKLMHSAMESQSKNNDQVKKRSLEPKESLGNNITTTLTGGIFRPDLPQHMTNAITDMGFSYPKLLIQKTLSQTDVSPRHSRLLIPFSQITRQLVLTEEQETTLDDGASIEVLLLDTVGEVTKLSLRRRVKRDVTSYVLINGWDEVVIENELKRGEIIQLWSFRTQDGELRFLLVVLGEDYEDDD